MTARLLPNVFDLHLDLAMSDEQQILGYTLEPIYPTPPGYITTHAFILCSSCGSAISSSGGPKYNAVCLKCVDQLDLLNKLKR